MLSAISVFILKITSTEYRFYPNASIERMRKVGKAGCGSWVRDIEIKLDLNLPQSQSINNANIKKKNQRETSGLVKNKRIGFKQKNNLEVLK